MNAITSTQVSRHYWWLMAIRGLLAVLFGLAAIVWPRLTLFVLVILFGAYALVDGVVAVIVSFSRRLPIAHEWTLVLAGILSVLFGVLLAILPGVGLLSLEWLIGIYALAFGVVLIIRAFQFRTVGTAYT